MKEIYSSSRSYTGLSRTDDTADWLTAVLIIIQHRQYLGPHAWGGTADQTPRESFPNIESFFTNWVEKRLRKCYGRHSIYLHSDWLCVHCKWFLVAIPIFEIISTFLLIDSSSFTISEELKKHHGHQVYTAGNKPIVVNLADWGQRPTNILGRDLSLGRKILLFPNTLF